MVTDSARAVVLTSAARTPPSVSELEITYCVGGTGQLRKAISVAAGTPALSKSGMNERLHDCTAMY